MSINVFTGPRCKLLMNGTVIGLGRSVQAQDELTYDAIKVLNSIEVKSFEPIDYNASGGMGEVMIVGKTLEALGLVAKKGQNAAEHLRNILALPDITMQIEDNLGTIIARLFGARITSREFAVDARSSVGRNVQLVGTRLVEASEF